MFFLPRLLRIRQIVQDRMPQVSSIHVELDALESFQRQLRETLEEAEYR